jgi:hypothetical protein
MSESLVAREFIALGKARRERIRDETSTPLIGARQNECHSVANHT